MNFKILVDCVLIVLLLLIASTPFITSSRVHQRWAKAVFIAVGVIGVIMGSTELLLDFHWFEPTNEMAWRVHYGLAWSRGMLLGMIFSLIASGQLLGVRRRDLERNNASAT